MPKTRTGRTLYALLLLTGFLLLGCSLYRKHQSSPGIGDRNSEPDNVFSHAVVANDPMTVEALLKSGVRLDALHSKYGRPALQQAALYGRLAIVNLLLAHGAKLQEQAEYYNTTPLGEAMRGLRDNVTQDYAQPSKLEDYRAVIETLQAKGARLSLYEAVALNNWPALLTAYRDGETVNGNQWAAWPLHRAARNGNVAMTKWLLEHGAQINAAGARGTTALFEAAAGQPSDESRKTVMLLLAHGADVNVTGTSGLTPLMGAVADFTGETASLLLAHGADMERYTPRIGPFVVGGYRLPIGQPPSSMADTISLDYGGTALTQAAYNGNEAMVSILLAHGAKINALDGSNHTPLLASLHGHQPKITALLLRCGANMKTPDETGDTPLLAAAVYSPKAIPLLLKLGADINEHTRDGDTALIRAARYGRADTIETLLRAGADPNAVNRSGWTPLLWAVGGKPQAVSTLIAAGANVNAANNLGETPLYRAIFVNRTGAIRALLAAHANPNIASAKGNMPLSMARKWQQPVTVALLVEAGGRE